MADLDDIYSSRILELAAEIPRAERLKAPDATGRAQSKLCGSTVEVDVNLSDDVVTDFGQTVKACLLGQAAASVVGREIVGSTVEEFRAVRQVMHAMLTQGGPPPEGRWADLATLQSVKDYPHRHASTMLVFDAVLSAIDEDNSKSSHATDVTATTKAAGAA